MYAGPPCQKKGYTMERKALIICPHCRKVRKFGEWSELTYDDRLVVNSFTVEEITKVCDGCQITTDGTVSFVSNA